MNLGIHTWFSASMMIAAWMAMPSNAFAHLEIYNVTLSGPAEAPPNASPGTGVATVEFDLDLVTLKVSTSFSGLLGNVTAAHIHGATAIAGTGTAGVITQTPTFSGFPTGATSGTYTNTFDLTLASSYNAAYITANGGTVSGALNAFVLAAQSGKAYLNIHTTSFPGGEIRGFLTAVPEPSSVALVGLVLGGIAVRYRQRKSSEEKVSK